VTLRGITWNHPRGYRALDAIAEREGGIAWSRQSLSGFEETPLRELAARFDLLVIDHPNLGDPDAAGALVPLDREPALADLVAELRAQSVGESFSSYEVGGRLWALPIDAATQVAVRTPRCPVPPTSWRAVVDVAREVPTALCLGGPHAFLMLAALCAADGDPLLDEAGEWGDLNTLETALDLMRRLLTVVDREASQLTPIRLLDLMASGEGPDLCPLVYGYVSYQEGPAPRLRASDAPRGAAAHGSVLGGTGVALSAAADRAAAVVAAARLLSAEVQRTVYPERGGQSARLDVWRDTAANTAVHDFYRDTEATMRDAWVRPRVPWYPALQREGSDLVRDGLLEGRPTREIRDALIDCRRELKESA